MAEIAREALRKAQTHRSEFMWPWEETPASVAHGILDDETCDWHAVVAGLIELRREGALFPPGIAAQVRAASELLH